LVLASTALATPKGMPMVCTVVIKREPAGAPLLVHECLVVIIL
jgi:hypothetical protein